MLAGAHKSERRLQVDTLTHTLLLCGKFWLTPVIWVTQNPIYKSQEVTEYNTDSNKDTADWRGGK